MAHWMESGTSSEILENSEVLSKASFSVLQRKPVLPLELSVIETRRTPGVTYSNDLIFQMGKGEV